MHIISLFLVTINKYAKTLRLKVIAGLLKMGNVFQLALSLSICCKMRKHSKKYFCPVRGRAQKRPCRLLMSKGVSADQPVYLIKGFLTAFSKLTRLFRNKFLHYSLIRERDIPLSGQNEMVKYHYINHSTYIIKLLRQVNI